MQRVLKSIRSVPSRLSRSRSPFVVGLITCIIVTAVVVVTGYIYLAPPNRTTIEFEARDAVSLSADVEVRLAGVAVGKVSGLRIEDDRVRVAAQVDSSIHLGDQTQVQVRLLTPVGGYFVALLPMGEQPLGDNVIPAERVKTPYTIADTLQALPRITDSVDGGDLGATLDELSAGFGHNSEAVTELVGALDSLASIADRQKSQVTEILDVSAEYMQTFNGSREFVFDLLQRLNVVLQTFHTYRAGFSVSYELLGDILMRLAPIAQFYVNHSDVVASTVESARQKSATLRAQMDGIIDALGPVHHQLTALLGAGGPSITGANVIDGSTICLPVAGRKC